MATTRTFTPTAELPDEEDQVSRLLSQWDQYTTLVNQLEMGLRDTRNSIGEDVDLVELKLESVSTRLGSDPGVAKSRCATVWDVVAYIKGGRGGGFKG